MCVCVRFREKNKNKTRRRKNLSVRYPTHSLPPATRPHSQGHTHIAHTY